MSKKRWGYVLGGVLILLFAGLVYAWSVLSIPISAEFKNYGKGALSLNFTIAMSFFCIGGFLGGVIGKKLKERYVFLISAILFLLGFILVSNMQSISSLYIGFGVMSGLGAGLSYNTVMSSVTKWFPDKKGLVSGILLMGFGIGAFIIGKVYTSLLSSYSWREEFRVLGVIVFLVILIGGFLLRKPKENEVTQTKEDEVEEVGNDFTTLEMMKKLSFWLFFIYAVMLSAAALALIAQAGGIALETDGKLSAGSVATVVGLISIFNGIGRVIFGTLYDKVGQKKTMLCNCVLFVASVLVTMAGLNTGSLVFLVAGFILFGLSYGGVPPTNSAFIMDFYGVKNYPVNFSIVNLNLLFASFGGTLAGVVYDMQKSYMTIFVIMIVAVVIALGCTFAIRRPIRVEK